MMTDRNRGYAAFYRQKAPDLKVRIEVLEKALRLAQVRIEALEKALRLAQIRIGHGSECTDHTECKAISAALRGEEEKQP